MFPLLLRLLHVVYVGDTNVLVFIRQKFNTLFLEYIHVVYLELMCSV